MDRRGFVAGVGGLLAARIVGAQGRVPRIGYLFSFARPQGEHLWEACRQGLRELGYVEGRTVILEPRWADGRHERLPALVDELVALSVDVVVAAATPAAQASKARAGRIPIVLVAVADPVRSGLISSLARPGGQMTGLSLLTPELSGKRLELLVDILKQVPRLAVLLNPDNQSHDIFLDETGSAARKAGANVQVVRARNVPEIERALPEAVAQGATAMIVFDDPVLWSHRKLIVAQASKERLPVMYGYSEFVGEGGLISYGPHRPDLYRRTAGYVDRILKGANPGELPIERPVRFELHVNVGAARALGIGVPQTILLRADRVIE
jgi:putative ABC transport system substrate-binding protein